MGASSSDSYSSPKYSEKEELIRDIEDLIRRGQYNEQLYEVVKEKIVESPYSITELPIDEWKETINENIEKRKKDLANLEDLANFLE